MSVREWEKVAIGTGHFEIPRGAADQLLAAARKARQELRIGGPDRDAILSEHNGVLQAGQVVGLLATPAAQLEILPKIDGLDDGATRVNLVRMLAQTIGLKVAKGELASLAVQRHDILEILIGLFCDRLFAAAHRGLPRRYKADLEDLKALRGRLDVKRQFTVLAASPQRIACRYEDLNVDIPLNQILKAAVSQLRRVSRVRENQRRLIELECVFGDVSAIFPNTWHYERIVLDRTNKAWHDLLRLARLFLRGRFQNTTLGTETGFALLFEMNALFEKFIGRSIQQTLRASDLHASLQGPQRHALVEQCGKIPRFTTKPDVTIFRGAEPIMIVDTKWKRLSSSVDDPRFGVAQVDIYQMIAYATVHDVKRVMLLYPYHGGLEAPGVQVDYAISGMPEANIRVATLDLFNIETVAQQLAALCSQDDAPKLSSTATT